MMNVQIIGYKRTKPGEIGSAFERHAEVAVPTAGVADAVASMLSSLGATGNHVVQADTSGRAIAVAPVHDETIHGFETHPYQIAVWPGDPRVPFAVTERTSAVANLEDVGSVVAKLAA